MDVNTGNPCIISFASPKGGVGKSTACACLAGALAAKGHRVHIIDLDQNRTLATWASRFPDQLRGIAVEALGEGALIPRVKDLYASARGFVLIDVAGLLHTTTVAAATIAHLTISPSRLSAPDIIESVKLHREMLKLGDRIGKPVLHRLLINGASPIWPTYQRAALADADACGLQRFETVLHDRAAYAELFLTGQTPHWADRAREPVAKAVKQLDAWTDEVLDLLQINPMKAAA